MPSAHVHLESAATIDINGLAESSSPTTCRSEDSEAVSSRSSTQRPEDGLPTDTPLPNNMTPSPLSSGPGTHPAYIYLSWGFKVVRDQGVRVAMRRINWGERRCI